MTGGFDPGRFTAAPLQTQGVIRFPGSPDPVFARITDHATMTDWVPLLKTVQVWQSESAVTGSEHGRNDPRTGAPRRRDHQL